MRGGAVKSEVHLYFIMHSQTVLSSLASVKFISPSSVFNGFFTRPKRGKGDNTADVKTGITRGRERFAVDIDLLGTGL